MAFSPRRSFSVRVGPDGFSAGARCTCFFVAVCESAWGTQPEANARHKVRATLVSAGFLIRSKIALFFIFDCSSVNARQFRSRNPGLLLGRYLLAARCIVVRGRRKALP